MYHNSSSFGRISNYLTAGLLLAMPCSLINAQADLSHRKSDLQVQVRSTTGNVAIPNADVEIEMLNHSFRFGCAVELRHIDPHYNDYDQWTVDTLPQYCNSITYGNVMKWTYFESRTEQERLAMVDLAQSLKGFNSPDDMRMRGHVAIWGAEYQIPNDVKNSTDPEYVHDRIIEHITQYFTTYKDKGIDNYDLYNEHFHEREFIIEKILGENPSMEEEAAEVATWFQAAKQADPDAVLFLNDYNMLNNSWTPNDGDVHKYKEFVDAIRDAGGDVDGIGLQAHMGNWVSREDIVRRLEILAAPMAPTANHPEGLPGLPIEITELDIGTGIGDSRGEEGEAEIARAVIEASFENPSVIGVTIWGMNDAFHWRDNGMLFNDLDDSGVRIDNPVLKATGEVWADLVQNQWWEDHSGSSNASGDYTANTFKGTHRVTVTYNGETKEKIVHLDDNQAVTFTFAATPADASTYADWIALTDWGQAASGRTDDPDNDGRINAEEYFYGTDPLATDAAPSPFIVRDENGGHEFILPMRALSEDITVQLLKSTTLAPNSWTASPINLSELDYEDLGEVRHFEIPLGSLTARNFYQVTLSDGE